MRGCRAARVRWLVFAVVVTRVIALFRSAAHPIRGRMVEEHQSLAGVKIGEWRGGAPAVIPDKCSTAKRTQRASGHEHVHERTHRQAQRHADVSAASQWMPAPWRGIRTVVTDMQPCPVIAHAFGADGSEHSIARDNQTPSAPAPCSIAIPCSF